MLKRVVTLTESLLLFCFPDSRIVAHKKYIEQIINLNLLFSEYAWNQAISVITIVNIEYLVN